MESPPSWLLEFAEFAADRHCASRATLMVSVLGRLLTDGGPTHPQAVLERSRRTGRSAGALARTLDEFFVEHHLAFGLDEQTRLAAGRRRRRVDATPTPFRPAVAAFGEHLIRSRERAARAGTKQRADNTIEHALAVVRDLARFLCERTPKRDWASVDVADIEAFIREANRDRRLSVSRQFFRWARGNKIVLVDPTSTVRPRPQRAFTTPTLTIGEQRRLFKRWLHRPDVHPHEALAGVLGLLHAVSNAELRSIRVDQFDERRQALQIGSRPRPVPLDPASLAVVRRCLDHRARLGTRNPHLMVTVVTKTRSTPASPAYVTHLLDPADETIKRLRSTRLLDLIVSLDPKLVAEALGMDAGGLVTYLADSVDAGRLADHG